MYAFTLTPRHTRTFLKRKESLIGHEEKVQNLNQNRAVSTQVQHVNHAGELQNNEHSITAVSVILQSSLQLTSPLSTHKCVHSNCCEGLYALKSASKNLFQLKEFRQEDYRGS